MPKVTSEKKCVECNHVVRIEIENGPYVEIDGESWWHDESCSQHQPEPGYDMESMADHEINWLGYTNL